MNIAFVLAHISDRFGGPVAVVKNIGQQLAKMGNGVSYWATGDNRDQADSLPLSGVHVYGVDWPQAWYRSKGLRRGLEAEIASVDIMHVSEFWPYSTHMASRIGSRMGVPYMLAPAGAFEPWAMKSNRCKWLKKMGYLHLIGRSAVEGAACLQACSFKEVEHFRQMGCGGPVTIIPNGVDTSTFIPGDRTEAQDYWPIPKDRLMVLFMSRLSPEKGLDLLIPAWADLMRSPSSKDAMLVIAGPDDRGYQRVVERMIDTYDVSSRVCMIGMVHGRQKLALLRRADVFILPSYSENFGIVVAEALACGTPVITTTGTPWEQLHTVDAGRWVPPTKQDIGESLHELLGMSESQRQQMGERGAVLIREHYTWEEAARKFSTVCDCIMQGKPIPLHPEPKAVEKT